MVEVINFFSNQDGSVYASLKIVFVSLDDLIILEKTSLYYGLQYLISNFSNQRLHLSHFQYI